MGWWNNVKKKFKKWVGGDGKTITRSDGKKVTAGKHHSNTGKVVTDRSVQSYTNYQAKAGKAKVKRDTEKKQERQAKARQTEASRKSQAIKIENNQKDIAKVQNGMTQNDVAIVQNVSKMDSNAQKKFYDSMKDKKNAEKIGVKKDLGKKVAKAEEKAAEENPFLYNMIRNTSGIDTKKISEKATGEKIDTEKADSTAAGKVGTVAGQLVQYATTGGMAEGAIKEGLIKGGTKLASKTIAKVGAKEGTKKVAKATVKGALTSTAKKNVIKAGAKKAGNVGASAVAGGLASTPLDASMALSTSLKDGKIDKKEFAKEFGKNVALDTAFGGGIEVAGKGLGKAVKGAKNTKAINKVKRQIKADKKIVAKHDKMMKQIAKRDGKSKAKGGLVETAHASEMDGKKVITKSEKRKAQKRIAKNEAKLAKMQKKSNFKTKVAEEEKRIIQGKQNTARAKENKVITDWESTRGKGAKKLTTRSQKMSAIRKENEFKRTTKADLDNFRETGKVSETPTTKSTKNAYKVESTKPKTAEGTTFKAERTAEAPKQATTETKYAKSKADKAITEKSVKTDATAPKAESPNASKITAEYMAEHADDAPRRSYVSKADAEKAQKVVDKYQAKLDKVKSEKSTTPKSKYEQKVDSIKRQRDAEIAKFEEPKVTKEKVTTEKVTGEKTDFEKWLDEPVDAKEVPQEEIAKMHADAEKTATREKTVMPTREVDDTKPIRLPKSMPGEVAVELDSLYTNEAKLASKRAETTRVEDVNNIDKQIKDVTEQRTKAEHEIRVAQEHSATIKEDTERTLSTLETDVDKIKFEDEKSSLTKEDIAEGNKTVVNNMRAQAEGLADFDSYMSELEELMGKPKSVEEYIKRVKLYNEEVAHFKLELQRKAQAFNDLQEGAEIAHVAKWGKPKEPFRKTFKNIITEIRTKGVNSLAAIDDYATKLIKAGIVVEGKALRASANAIRTATARASIAISKRQLSYDGQEVGKSLLDIFERHVKGKSEDEIRELDEFLRHYDNQYRAKRRGDDVSIFGEPVSAEVSKAFVERMLKKHPEWAELVEDIAKWEKNEQQFRVQSGMISEEMAAKLQAEQPFHVPAHRTDVVGENVFGAVERAHGSTRNLVPIMQDMAEQTQKMHMDAAMSDLARDMERCNNVVMDTASQAVKGSKTEKDMLSLMNFIGGDENHRTFAFFENGEVTTFEVPEEIHQALVEEKEQTKLIRRGALNKVGNVRKAILTTLSVSFAIRNGFRDLVEAGLNYDLKGYITHLPRAQWVAIKMMLGKTDDPWLKLYEATGSGDSQFFSFNNYDKLMRELEGGASKGAKVINTIERFSSAIEMAPRLACFMDTVEKHGYNATNCPHDVAMLASREGDEATLNFGRGGNITRKLNANGFIFLNAIVQGGSKAVRNIIEQPDIKHIGKYVAKGAFYGASMASMNHLLNSKNENYEYLNARDKINNLVVPLKNDRMLMIPQSYLATMFIAPFAMSDPTSKGHRMDMLKTAIKNNFMVVPSEFSGTFVVAPVFQAFRNKSWTGAEIVPSYQKENTAKGEIVDANTTAVSRFLGKLFPNHVSPKTIDYVGQQYGGDFWKAYAFLTSPAKQGSGAWQLPFISSFIKDATYSNSISGDYYSMKTKINTATSKTKKTDKWKEQSDNFKTHETAISDTTSAIRELQNSDDKDKGEKLKKLTDLRNEMMKDAMTGKAFTGTNKQWKVYKSVFGNEKTIEKLGSKDDSRAMTFYKKETGKVDDDFYKATKARNKYLTDIKKETDKRVKQDGLGEAIAIYNSGANDTVADAYGLTIKGRIDTADKYKRAREYVKNGGTIKEYIAYKKAITEINYSGQAKEEKLEKTVRDMEEGKKGSAKELAQAWKDLKKSRNGSYVVKAMQLAYMGASNRVYMVFDIKDRNVQNGINLAAMGIKPRDYSNIKSKMDTDGNGYIKKAEAVEYCESHYKTQKEKSAVFGAMSSPLSKNPYGSASFSAKDAQKVGEEKGYSNPKSTANTTTKYVIKKKVLHDVPVSVTYRNGETQSLQGMTEEEVAKLNLNAKSVQKITYGDRTITEKVKKKVKQKAKKDNSKLPTSSSSSGSSYGWRSYSRRYSRSYGRSGGSSKVAKTSVATVTPPHATIKEKHEMTDAQIRAEQKKLLAKSYAKYAVKK